MDRGEHLDCLWAISGTTRWGFVFFDFLSGRNERALDIPLKDVSHFYVCSETVGKFGAVLDKVVSFPYAQHMLSDSPGTHTYYGSEKALREAVEKVDFKKIKTLAR